MDGRLLVRRSGQVAQGVLDLLFPPLCAGCKQRGAIICTTCLRKMQPDPLPRCERCQNPLPAYGSACQECLFHPLRLNGLYTVSTYKEPLRSCIHALKYSGHRRLDSVLGTLLAQAYVNAGLQADLLVPVPLHSDRLQQRGYNQAALLARVCASQIGIPCQEDILLRHRATPTQVGLGPDERRHNVTGAFRCHAPWLNGQLFRRHIVIIDDISTTGATLEACAIPLFAAGAATVWGLVLAKARG